MSSTQKRLIVVIASLTLLGLLVLTITGFLLLRFKTNPPQVHQKALIAEMTYCNAENLTPCVISFSADADGNMLVNLLTPPTYPAFYLTLSKTGIENKYECQAVADFPTSAYCTGAPMNPGETVQFTIHTIEADALLAEGRLTIIGVLLATPAKETTATLPPDIATEASIAETETPIGTAAPIIILGDTPTPTEATSSSPNPTSYPNPSYP